MKKKKVELKEIPGWTAITRVHVYCHGCGCLRDFPDTAYWKKSGERMVINCEGCAKK